MVDYKKLQRDRYESASPEERERIDHAEESVTVENARSRPIGGRFTKEALTNEGFVPVKTWDQDLMVFVERNKENRSGRADILRFRGGSTGYEGFELTERIRSEMRAGKPGETWSICAGGGTWPVCEVSLADVAGFLEQDDRRHAREVNELTATHEPATMKIEATMARDGAFDAAARGKGEDGTVLWDQVEVSVLRDHAAGTSKLRISAPDGVETSDLDEALREKIKKLSKEGRPYMLGGADDNVGLAVTADDLAGAITKADRHLARDVARAATSIPKTHSIAIEGSTERLEASVRRREGGGDLRLFAGDFRAATAITATFVERISGVADDKVMQLSSTETPHQGETQTRNVRMGDLKRVLAHEGFGESRERRRLNEVAMAPDVAAKMSIGASAALDVATKAVNEMPDRKRDRSGRELVAVQVTRSDLQAVLDHDGKGNAGDGYAKALKFFTGSVEQPVFKDFRPTGEVVEKAAGLALLKGGFGHSTSHRKLWFGRDAMATAIVERGNAGLTMLTALREGAAQRQESIDKAKPAKNAGRPRAAAGAER